jgi:DNA-directed RNA polymerase subunit RPC12/RpoP
VEKFFLCEYCLQHTNVGKYYTEKGTCAHCKRANVDGNYVTQEDIDTADKLGEDSVGVEWQGCMPEYNVANTDTVCPICGYHIIDRVKKEHMNIPNIAGPARYKCNDCGKPLRIINVGYTSPIQTEEELGKWIERHKAILKPNQTYVLPNKHTLRLCIDESSKCVFFVDYRHRVIGKMLRAPTVKTRDIWISKVVMNALLGHDYRYECKWRQR